MKTVYDNHPAADIFPMMDEASFSALKADIAEHGQREYTVLFDGKIIDGRNRYRACQELGIECDLSELEECDDPIAYVVSANLHRRHLTTSQRAAIAAKLANGSQGGDHKSEKIKGSNGPLKIDDAAKLLNVSSKSVKRAKEVLRTSDKETIAKVESGKLTVGKATKAKKPAKATTPKKELTKSSGDSDSEYRFGTGAAMLGIMCPSLQWQIAEMAHALRSAWDEIANEIETADAEQIADWRGLADIIEEHSCSLLNAVECREAELSDQEDDDQEATEASFHESEYIIDRKDDGFFIVVDDGRTIGPFMSRKSAIDRAEQLATSDAGGHEQ